jgi:hypothetical protein
MREILIASLTTLIQLSGYAQTKDTIKVSTDIELIKISANAYVHVSCYEFPDLFLITGMLTVWGDWI